MLTAFHPNFVYQFQYSSKAISSKICKRTARKHGTFNWTLFGSDCCRLPHRHRAVRVLVLCGQQTRGGRIVRGAMRYKRSHQLLTNLPIGVSTDAVHELAIEDVCLVQRKKLTWTSYELVAKISYFNYVNSTYHADMVVALVWSSMFWAKTRYSINRTGYMGSCSTPWSQYSVGYIFKLHTNKSENTRKFSIQISHI